MLGIPVVTFRLTHVMVSPPSMRTFAFDMLPRLSCFAADASPLLRPLTFGVVGAGLMGSGIAQCLALSAWRDGAVSGGTVMVHDVDVARAAKSLEHVNASLAKVRLCVRGVAFAHDVLVARVLKDTVRRGWCRSSRAKAGSPSSR